MHVFIAQFQSSGKSLLCLYHKKKVIRIVREAALNRIERKIALVLVKFHYFEIEMDICRKKSFSDFLTREKVMKKSGKKT